jgi:hypothetical protein
MINGKSMLIKIDVEKKYLWPLKIILILISLPFILNVYNIYVSGVAESGQYTFVQGEHRGYYSHLFKHLVISLLLLWLGLFGINAKKQ